MAHHAGNNAHFYRALLEAGYADQVGESLLLVSHATRDRHRPSAEFAMFLEQSSRPTGQPRRSCSPASPRPRRCARFRDAIHPVVGEPHLVGDVRIGFDGDRWTVQRHAIRA